MSQLHSGPSRQIIIIGGAGGVGKTSIVRSLAQLYSEHSGRSISIFSTGDYFASLFNDSSRLERDHVKNVHWKKFEQKVADLIIRDLCTLPISSIYLLDTHFAANSPAGYMMGIGIKQVEQLAKELKSSSDPTNLVHAAIILIEADIADVLRRRSTDVARLREYSVLDVMSDLEQTRLYSLLYYQTLASELGSNSVEYMQINNDHLSDSANAIFAQLTEWGFA